MHIVYRNMSHARCEQDMKYQQNRTNGQWLLSSVFPQWIEISAQAVQPGVVILCTDADKSDRRPNHHTSPS